MVLCALLMVHFSEQLSECFTYINLANIQVEVGTMPGSVVKLVGSD